VVDVVGHPTQNGVDDRFGRIAALGIVPLNLLDPLQVGDRYHPYQEIGITGHVIALADDSAVQTLVKKKVGVFWNRLPGGELARF